MQQFLKNIYTNSLRTLRRSASRVHLPLFSSAPHTRTRTLTNLLAGGVVVGIVLVFVFGPVGARQVQAAFLGIDLGIASAFEAAFVAVPAIFATILMNVAALILWLTGWLLEATIALLVRGMANTMDSIGAIEIAWQTLRDLANMVFIFILLYIGFTTILRANTSTLKTLLAKVIIVALLLNFSFFFTRAVIDASNILAVNSATFVDGDNNTITAGAAMISAMRIQTFYDFAERATDGTSIGEALGEAARSLNFRALATQISAIVMMIIVAGIFFIMAALLVVRFVVLIFVVITSPIAFVATIVPGLNNIWDQWLNALLHQSFFAPIFFILLGVVVQITDQTSAVLNASDASFSAALLSGDVAGSFESVFGIFINYAVVVALLIGVLIASKTFAIRSGGLAASMINRGAQRAGGFFTRNTVGRAGEYGRRFGTWSRDVAYDKENKQRTGRIGRTVAKTAHYTGFAGAARTVGRAEDIKAVVPGETDGKSRTQVVQDRGNRYKRQLDQFAGSPAQQAQFIRSRPLPQQQRQAYEQLSAKDKVAVDKHLQSQDPQFFRNVLTRKRVLQADLQKGLSGEQKEQLLDARMKSHRGESEDVAADLAGMSENDRETAYEKLSPRDRAAAELALKNNQSWTDDQVDKLRKSLNQEQQDKTGEESGKIETAAKAKEITDALNEFNTSGGTQLTQDLIDKMDDGNFDAAKLKPETATNDHIIDKYTSEDLRKLARNTSTPNKLSNTQKRLIFDRITRNGSTATASAQGYMGLGNSKNFWQV